MVTLADGRVIEQKFEYDAGDPLAGQKKGLMTILVERGLLTTEQARATKLEALRALLAAQADFSGQSDGIGPTIGEVLAELNAKFPGAPRHRRVFLPKGHPDLNPIESVWALMKKRVAAKWLPGRLARGDLMRRVQEAMATITQQEVARCVRHSLLFVYMYLHPRMDVARAKLAARRYTGHRVAHGSRVLRWLVDEAAGHAAAGLVDAAAQAGAGLVEAAVHAGAGVVETAAHAGAGVIADADDAGAGSRRRGRKRQLESIA